MCTLAVQVLSSTFAIERMLDSCIHVHKTVSSSNVDHRTPIGNLILAVLMHIVQGFIVCGTLYSGAIIPTRGEVVRASL